MFVCCAVRSRRPLGVNSKTRNRACTLAERLFAPARSCAKIRFIFIIPNKMVKVFSFTCQSGVVLLPFVVNGYVNVERVAVFCIVAHGVGRQKQHHGPAVLNQQLRPLKMHQLSCLSVAPCYFRNRDERFFAGLQFSPSAEQNRASERPFCVKLPCMSFTMA